MAKQLNVNLAFTADTGKAKSQLQDLQTSLNHLVQTTASKTSGLGLTRDLNEAINAANELKIKLQQSTTSTGSLDLGKFNQSLKESGKQLSFYAENLRMLGPDGQQAFSQLARSISQAEVPLKKSNKLLEEFSTTLKNTARWQISSSILHGFMGSIQSAYRYAQDLNESLTNIRIVTGQNSDQMAEFADQANKAAKALSTTTTQYTDAALIYYQQGLNDKQVKERTDITVKLANATGESAQEVSDQMTAIWNNFDDGSQSLEHYADVLTALGAATASSTDEISTGLEKFASVADMIGLSYENAAAALATVTAATRQSADVVGTAFKTIFARIQGLKLGETLEDDTTLNKYSQALESVGINIKDQSGNLKDMDLILNELGSKWKSIDKDQQVALAQTVAGVRQYNQLVSLMDNWDDFQQNLITAEGSTGELQKQANTYAEGWEAARDRVKAAAEDIYGELLNDKAFISILNLVEKLVSGFGELIDVMGGLQGVLPLVAMLMVKSFGPDIANSIDRVFYNMQIGSKKGRDAILQLRKDAAKAIRDIYDDGTIFGSAMVDVGKTQSELQTSLLDKTLQLQKANKKLTQEEQKQAQELLDINATLGEQYAQLARNKEQQEELTRDLASKASRNLGNKAAGFYIPKQEEDGTETKTYQGKEGFSKAIQEAGKLQATYRLGRNIIKSYGNAINRLGDSTDVTSEDFKTLQLRIKSLGQAAEKAGADVESELGGLIAELGRAAQSGNIVKLQEIIKQIGVMSEQAGNDSYDMFDAISEGVLNAGVDMQKFTPIINQLQASFEQTGTFTAQQIQLLANLGFQADEAGNIIGRFKGKVASVGDAISQGTQAATSYGMALSQAAAFGENLFNPDTKPLEQLISFLMLAGTATQAFNDIKKAGKVIDEAVAAAKARKAAASAAAAVAQEAETVATEAGTVATNANTVAVNANKAAWMTHPIIGVIAIALMAVVGAISIVSSKMAANAAKVKESADASKEKADASYKEVEANNKLIDSYDKALAAYEAGTGSKEDLESATTALCDAYDIENVKLLEAKGNYDALTKAIKEAEAAKLKAGIQDTELAKADAEAVLEDTMRKGKGRFSGDKYKVDFGNIFNLSEDDQAVLDAVKSLQSKGGLKTALEDNSESGLLTLTAGQKPQDLINAYEDVQAVILETRTMAEKNGTTDELTKSEYYNDMLDWLSKSEDSYNNLVALQKQLQDLSVMQATEEITSKNEDVSSMENYLKVEKELADNLAANKSLGLSAEEAEKLARASLASKDAYAQMANDAQIIEDAANATGATLSKSELQDFYNSLDKKEQKIFATLNFDSAKSIADLEDQLKVLQARADVTSIRTNLEIVNTAKSDLKKDMSSDDYSKYQTSSGIDWGNKEEGIMEYSEFLAMSYESQSAYLEGLSKQYSNVLGEATQTAIDADTERIAQLGPLSTEADKKLAEVQSSLDINKIKLSIDDKGTLATDISQVTNEILKLNNLDVNSEEYSTLLTKLKDSGIDEATITSYLDAYNASVSYKNETESLNDEIDKLKAQGEIDAIINVKTNLEGAKTLSDLQAAWQTALNNDPDHALQYTLYSDALLKLAESYDNCTNEIEDFQKALSYGDSESIDSAQKTLESAIKIGEASEKYGLSVEDVETQSKILADQYDLTADAASNLAIANQRMNKGVKALAENWGDWSKVLKKNNKTTTDYADVLNDANAALADLVGVVDVASIPLDFLDASTESGAAHLKLMEKAAKGDTQAINILGAAMGQATVEAMEFNQSFVNSLIASGQLEQGFDLTAFNTYKNEVLEGVTALQQAIADGSISAGQNITSMLDGTGQSWVTGLNAMAMATGMGVTQMNALLNQLGVQAKVDVKDVTQKMSVPTYTEYSQVEQSDPGQQDSNGTWITPPTWAKKTWTVPGPSKEIEGTVQVAQISTEEGTIGAPQITYTGTGGSVISGVSPPSTTSKGGGGGSKSKKEPKKITEEQERYHEIKAVIEDLTGALDKLNKAKERAWGVSKLKYIDAEIAKTEELIAAQKNYIKEIEKNLTSDKSAIAAYGATFDTTGNINNYDEIIAQQVAKYNEAVAAFNKDQNEETFAIAEKAYEDFKTILDKYEETNNLLQEQQQDLQDKILEELDKRLEKIQESVSMRISVREDDLEYLEYQLGKLEDQAFSTAQALSLIATNIEALMSESDTYTTGISQILAIRDAGGELTSDQIDTLRDYKSSLIDVNNQLIELRTTMEESVLKGIEEFTDKLDKSISRFDTYSSVMSNYANIVELSGRSSRDSALLIQLSTAMVDSSISKLTGVKEKYDALVASQQSAQENLLKAQRSGDSEAIKYWTNTLEDISIKVEETQDEMQQSWADALTAAADKFDKVVEITIAKLEDALSAFTDLDTFSDVYSKAQSAADRFLSDNEKIYELNKLNRDINKSIDNTTNLAAKTKLKEVLEEINKLQSDNVTMSKYDLDYLQAKYNLKVAEIALEEAQNAKNQVRLTRDSEGNWGYTYTADQTKIDEAQQNYDDNLQSLRQLSEDYIKDMSDQIIQNQQEMADALAGIDKNRADYTTEVARITEYYINQDMYLRQELDKAVVNSGTTYGETILGQIENAQSWQEAHQNMADSTYAALATLNTAYNEWKNNVDTVMKAAGTSSNDFTQTVKNDLDTINSKSNELEQTLEEDSQNMVSYIDTIMDKVSSWQSSYGRAISDMIKANEALMVSINKIIAAQGGMTPLSAKTGYDVSVDYSALMQSYLAAGGSNEDIINQLQTEREAKITGEGYTQEYYGRRGAEALQYMRNNPYAYYDQTKVKELLAKLGITSFASGGYTGDWGPEAKLAGIHEKEIILNADDTSNFLKAIDMVRSISNILDQKAVLASLGLLGVTSGGVLDTSSQQLSQEVTIHAEFPNATDRNEIEEAFNSLIGTASQYANRK